MYYIDKNIDKKVLFFYFTLRYQTIFPNKNNLIVFIHRLQSKIFFNLAVFLILAVLLTDCLTIVIVQKKLILDKIHSGHNFLLKLKENIIQLKDPNIAAVADPSLIYGLLILAPDLAYEFGECAPDINLDIPKVLRRAINRNEMIVAYSGDTWGVFWKQKKYLVISVPFSEKLDAASGGTLIFKLDGMYKTLRSSQKYVAFYLGINCFILLLLGFYRFSRLVSRPIQKIIKIAKDYTDSERLQFSPDKRSYEFNELSNALNRMVYRIETDKEKLQKSLAMLQQANAELKATQAEMIRTEKMASIGRLSAGIAHEIGNPISIVLGYLGLLRNRPGMENDTAGQDYILRSENEINRINEIIRQMLDFSRTTTVRFCKISIHDLVRDIVHVMREQPLMRHIQIEDNLSSSRDSVYADYNLMRQVMMNLMINAADSIAISTNPLQGKITISTILIPETHENAIGRAPTLQLTVVDNGTGIAAKDFDNIFDPFYTTKEPGKGTGLGLSVSYTIVEQAGGLIYADSEIGKGTTMVMLFPLLEDPSDSYLII
jgi:two-component system, NtrC family, sensor kinase